MNYKINSKKQLIVDALVIFITFQIIAYMEIENIFIEFICIFVPLALVETVRVVKYLFDVKKKNSNFKKDA